MNLKTITGGALSSSPATSRDPLLELPREDFERLAREIDAIYHNGAWVNLFYAYSTLKPVNVSCTQEVLRLAFVVYLVGRLLGRWLTSRQKVSAAR